MNGTGVVANVVGGVLAPALIAVPLRGFLDHLDRTPLPDLTAAHVATFDHHKRFSLYLTYSSYGDTRKRGYRSRGPVKPPRGWERVGWAAGTGPVPTRFAGRRRLPDRDLGPCPARPCAAAGSPAGSRRWG